MTTSPITTHILNTTLGKPAVNVPLTLEMRVSDDKWELLSRKSTDADGKVKDLLPAGSVLRKGVYKLTFETGSYFESLSVKSFYPTVAVVFEITAPQEHYHVPLLLNPFGYSTYRGT